MKSRKIVTGKQGGTLIEVMMACVVLAVIAVAGGAYVYQALGTLAFHRDRAVAVARANSWMEDLKAGGYRSLTQQMVSTPFYVVTNNAVAKLEYWPVSTARDAVRITVQITNRAPDYVSMVTIYAQEWRHP